MPRIVLLLDGWLTLEVSAGTDSGTLGARQRRRGECLVRRHQQKTRKETRQTSSPLTHFDSVSRGSRHLGQSHELIGPTRLTSPTMRLVQGSKSSCTVCPKVACNSNVPLFSAKCGLNPKPFGLLIAHMVRFVMMYDMALLITN